MKKFLPKTSTNTQGFTLVELLVVISIIAILAVIGVTVYSGVQKNARDAKRKADVNAISDALEVQKLPNTAVYPNPVLTTYFASGVTPTLPSGGNYTVTWSTTPANATFCVCSDALEDTTSGNASSAGAAGVCAFSSVTKTFYCNSNQQ